MSQEQARACVDRMKGDRAFQARVLGAESETARTQVIHAEGFVCSAAELEAVAAELEDADLDLVAGGRSRSLTNNRDY